MQALAPLARVGRAHARLHPLAIPRARERELADARQQLLDVAPQRRRRAAAGDALGFRIERRDAALAIDREQTAHQALDRVLVETRQPREILGALAQGLARALELGAEQAREHRHQHHGARVHRPDRQHQRPRPRRDQRRRRQPARLRREQHHAVRENGERRRGERAAALEEQRTVDGDQHEQEREHGIHAAREADEAAHDGDVGRDVDRGEATAIAHPRQHQPVDGGREEREADGAPQPARLREAVADADRVERDGDAQAHEREREARAHQDHEALGQPRAGLRGDAARGLRIRARRRRLGHDGNDRQPIVSAILKIGRYIAISMPPTVPPSPTIISGSSIAVSASTAASTSSS